MKQTSPVAATRAAWLVTAGAAVCALATGCASSGAKASDDAKVGTAKGNLRSVLAQSAATTQAAKTMRVSLSTSAAGGTDEAGDYSASYAIDLQTRNLVLTATFASLNTKPVSALNGTFEQRIIAKTDYVRFPAGTSALPAGKKWVKFEDTSSGSELPIPSPDGFLKALGSVTGSVSELGSAEVRGVSTTHYRANADIEQLGEAFTGQKQSASDIAETKKSFGSGTATEDVYIDKAGLVRRVSFTLTPGADRTEKGIGRVTGQLDFYDFGQVPASEFTAPPAAEVMDSGGSVSFGS